jgi:hypothetical protein
MNRYQRFWAAGALLLLGIILSVTAFEWGFERPGMGIAIVKNVPKPGTGLLAEVANCDWAQYCDKGIYVLRSWGRMALVWGGVLPFCFAARQTR